MKKVVLAILVFLVLASATHAQPSGNLSYVVSGRAWTFEDGIETGMRTDSDNDSVTSSNTIKVHAFADTSLGGGTGFGRYSSRFVPHSNGIGLMSMRVQSGATGRTHQSSGTTFAGIGEGRAIGGTSANLNGVTHDLNIYYASTGLSQQGGSPVTFGLYGSPYETGEHFSGRLTLEGPIPFVSFYMNASSISGAGSIDTPGEYGFGRSIQTVVVWGPPTPIFTESNPLGPDAPSGDSVVSNENVYEIPVVEELGFSDSIFLQTDFLSDFDFVAEHINFSQLLIPSELANGTDEFTIEFDGYSEILRVGEEFDFTSFVNGGVSEFSISGIRGSGSLDRMNEFVAGLRFVDEGYNSVYISNSIPEPTSLVVLGIVAMGTVVRRKRN